MSKQFRNCDLNQALLLPPSFEDWLPEGHLPRFVADVVERLDLSGLYDKHEEGDGRGKAVYDPPMMMRLSIYGHCRGVATSRSSGACRRWGSLRGQPSLREPKGTGA